MKKYSDQCRNVKVCIGERCHVNVNVSEQKTAL